MDTSYFVEVKLDYSDAWHLLVLKLNIDFLNVTSPFLMPPLPGRDCDIGLL